MSLKINIKEMLPCGTPIIASSLDFEPLKNYMEKIFKTQCDFEPYIKLNKSLKYNACFIKCKLADGQIIRICADEMKYSHVQKDKWNNYIQCGKSQNLLNDFIEECKQAVKEVHILKKNQVKEFENLLSK